MATQTPVVDIPQNFPAAIADVDGLADALAAKEATANKGAANGYAPLDAGSKVPVANLPAATGAAAGTLAPADYTKLTHVPSDTQAELDAKADESGGTLTTPTIDGELSSVTKQQRLTAQAAEYGAEARGLQLIERWDPTSNAQSKNFVLDGADYKRLFLKLNNVGDRATAFLVRLRADGGDSVTSCAGSLKFAGGNSGYQEDYGTVGGTNGAWSNTTYAQDIVVDLHKLPDGTWRYCCYSTQYMPSMPSFTLRGYLPPIDGYLQLYSTVANMFRANEAHVELWGEAESYPPAGRALRVAFIGDSNTEAIGDTATDVAIRGCPYQIASRVRGYGGSFVGTVNLTNGKLGRSGWSGGSVGPSRSVASKLNADLIAYDPDLGVVSIGVNDLDSGIGGLTPAQTAAYHAEFINQIWRYKPTMRLVVVSIFPVHESYATATNADIDATNAIIAANVAALAGAGKPISWIDVTATIKAVVGGLYAGSGIDFIHLNRADYIALATAIWPTVKTAMDLGYADAVPTNLAYGKTYTVSPAPNGSYPDTGGVQLTNGLVGEERYPGAPLDWHDVTVGWLNGDPIVTLDLATAQTVGRVLFHSGDGPSAGIYAPTAALVEYSTNGTDYATAGSDAALVAHEGWFEVAFAPVSARYVRLTLTRAAGGAVITSLGEIMVRAA